MKTENSLPFMTMMARILTRPLHMSLVSIIAWTVSLRECQGPKKGLPSGYAVIWTLLLLVGYRISPRPSEM